jgi:hypothetical protein
MLIEVPTTERQRKPVPEQSMTLEAPIKCTVAPWGLGGNTEVIVLLQLQNPKKTPDGTLTTPFNEAFMRSLTVG